MKCPMCGDELVNSKCRFCGYEETVSDLEARERYEAQKAAFTSDPRPRKPSKIRSDPTRSDKPPDGRSEPVRSGRPAQSGKPPDKQMRDGKPPGGQARTGKPAGQRPKGKSPPAKAEQKKSNKGRGKDREPGRPGFFKRWFFRLLVISWILLYIVAVIIRISKGPDFNSNGSQDINQFGQVQIDTLPGEGGAEDAR